MSQMQDFNKELFELMNKKNDDIDLENKNICLISTLKLEDKYITLKCRHSFNYSSILKEIKYQKLKNHGYEVQRLLHNQIKCPYCRTVQNGLLPLFEGYEKCVGVNWPEKYQYKGNKCIYTFLSGKRKGQHCSKPCVDNMCSSHKKITYKRKQKLKEKELKQKSKIKNKIKNSNLTYKRLMRKNKAELIHLAQEYGIVFLARDTKISLSNNILTKHNQLYPNKDLSITIPKHKNLHQNVVITI